MAEAPIPAPHAAAPHVHQASDTRTIWKVIAASSVGTMIEWYDFYIFGSLATILAGHFFPHGNSTLALLQTLATFAAGFAARPFGALFFGRIGDLVGRKYAFLVTLLIMGGATFVIGLLPGYATIGVAAPLILLLLRLVQGLALGGEYGGAATYVAEHVPNNRRGFYTAFIQTTATLGLFLSLLVILAVRSLMPTEDWERWGWRIPFLVSLALLGVSVWIRSRLNESPIFRRMKAEG
ncbi:MAG TPA: MFS transporter, partial [Longimicrobium sp.]|nr:MFS transporter [Longimicrobium sp.]